MSKATKSFHFQLLSDAYLEKYLQEAGMDWEKALKALESKNSFEKADFDYYVQSSAVYSSNIEGNSLDLDSYLKNKKFKIKSKPKETSEIDDLVSAYNLAVDSQLNEKNFLDCHKLLSRTILSVRSQRGKLRTQPVGIYSRGKLEYMAIEPEHLEAEFKKLFSDIYTLLSANLSTGEIFYYAAMLHLIFEKIHPFMDGNGRAGRLLEKWFIASKIGKAAWSIQSEKFYAEHRPEYYKNIHIGLNYYVLKMERCVDFLLMLVKAVKSPDFTNV
jgi:Fic family protein